MIEAPKPQAIFVRDGERRIVESVEQGINGPIVKFRVNVDRWYWSSWKDWQDWVRFAKEELPNESGAAR